jgi:predicted Zn-dependent protease
MPIWKAVLITILMTVLIVLPIAAGVSIWQNAQQEGALIRLACAPVFDDVLMRVFGKRYLELARLLYADKEYVLAMEMYKKFLKLNIWDAQVLFEAGLVYKKLGRLDLASEKFQQVVSLKPNPLLLLLARWESRGLPVIRVTTEEEPAGKIKEVSVYIVPFGVKDRIMLGDLAILLQNAYRVNFAVEEDRFQKNPSGYLKDRNQYDVDALFQDVKRDYSGLLTKPQTKGVLVVTSHDITCEGLNFVFGTIDATGQNGIISFARFKSDFPDNATLFKRIYTQALSTIGFMFGVERCQTVGCARSYPHSLFEFKKKGFRLCKDCKTNTRCALSKIDAPERVWSDEELKKLKEVKEKYKLDK